MSISDGDPLPGELNTLVRQGKQRTLGSDDIDASGQGLWRHKKYTVDKMLESNILKGITRYQAIILRAENINATNGSRLGQIVNAALGGSVRKAYRIRIPVLHQIIPNPCKEPDETKRLVFAKMHPLAVFEVDSFHDVNNTPGEGDIVWVSFKAGGAANRFKEPIIEAVIRESTGNTNAFGCSGPSSASQSFNSGYNSGGSVGGGSSAYTSNTSCRPPGTGATAAEIIAAYPQSAPIADQIVAFCEEVGIPDPGWLANLIDFETGHTWDPNIRNKNSGCVGLIQFCGTAAADVLGRGGQDTGTRSENFDKLGAMSAEEQFEYVKLYLEPKISGKTITNSADVYMAVFYPVSMGKPGDWSIAAHWDANHSAANSWANTGNGDIVTKADYANSLTRGARLPTTFCDESVVVETEIPTNSPPGNDLTQDIVF